MIGSNQIPTARYIPVNIHIITITFICGKNTLLVNDLKVITPIDIAAKNTLKPKHIPSLTPKQYIHKLYITHIIQLQ